MSTYQGPRWSNLNEKNRGKKTRDTVPLTKPLTFLAAAFSFLATKPLWYSKVYYASKVSKDIKVTFISNQYQVYSKA